MGRGGQEVACASGGSILQRGPQPLRTPRWPVYPWDEPLERPLPARFLERPNRFLLRCLLDGRTVNAFLPNPGRLWELLLPGATVYLAAAHTPGQTRLPGRRTRYTVLAVERDGVPVFLHTHLTNQVARWLIDRGLVPGLERAEVVRREVTVGRSRFDFLLRQGKRHLLLEVKSCTLFGNRVAMFPDAVTERGRRHLEHLASLTRPDRRGVVLFLAHTDQVDWFMPDYHTDLAFSRALLKVRRQLRIIPLAIAWDGQLALCGPPKKLEVPWGYLQREVQDRGGYLVILPLKRRRRLVVGALGELSFAPGYYVYAGSAMANLSARMARHLRRRKTMRWHIDYLRQVAGECTALAIRSSQRCECQLAAALNELGEPEPAGFGCSDCHCPTHLFRFEENPLHQASFHHLLQRFRMRPPD